MRSKEGSTGAGTLVGLDGDRRDVLARPEAEALIDVDEPVGLMLAGVIQHLGDDGGPDEIVQAYLDAVPSGSYLFLTHFCAPGPGALALQEAMLRDLGTGRFRTFEPVTDPTTVGQRKA